LSSFQRHFPSFVVDYSLSGNSHRLDNDFPYRQDYCPPARKVRFIAQPTRPTCPTGQHFHTDSLLPCVNRIAAGAYYEAHQQLRVIAARYIKQSNYDAAAELLAGGATALLRAGSQQGASASGGDLAIMLVVDVYNKAEWEIQGGDNDTEGRARKSEFGSSIGCFGLG
jgi:hypothetical protein